MNIRILPILILPLFFSCGSQEDLAGTVNPFIGTDYTGNTYPGAQAPFGMVQLSPDNGLPGWDRIAGYFYPDSTIAGFSHTHLSGTGAGDLYDVSFMPVTLPYKEAEAPLGVHSKFSHEREEASAGYYRVFLDDYGIDVELTATPRCGIQRYTFPQAQSAVILNLKKAMNWDRTLDSYIEVVDSRTIRGYRYSDGWARGQKIYFYTRFSRDFDDVTMDVSDIIEDEAVIGRAYVAQFQFNTSESEQILVTTGISGTGMDGALKNLTAEAPEDDFDKYREAARRSWNSHLGRIEVVGGSEDDRVCFYTALYRTMIAPTLWSDVDGRYYGPDGTVHQGVGYETYGTFSLWDTYRAAHPLLTYTQTSRVNDMVKSLLDFYDQNGRLPVWNFWGSETDMMIGYHSVPVIVDAYLKGIGDFDPERALEACVTTANLDGYRGIGEYKSLGYVPFDLDGCTDCEDWSLSKTLEYAFDDWCIARMAQELGREDLAEEFFARSENWRNVFDGEYMRPRDSRGRFQEGFSPDEYTKHICESNGWHYLWSVQHDIEGLIAACGGRGVVDGGLGVGDGGRFAEKLDSMFVYNPSADDELPLFSTGMIGQYAHGNEPSHHVIYLFNKVGQPWKTQKYAAEVMHGLYFNAPAGLCGNEDCGQMSAWYVLSAMGFYPVNPASGEYEIGTPLFPEVRLHLENGRTFTVLAHGVSRENIYIQSVRLNGEPLRQSFITHGQISSGATLEFEMGPEPAPAWWL